MPLRYTALGVMSCSFHFLTSLAFSLLTEVKVQLRVLEIYFAGRQFW